MHNFSYNSQSTRLHYLEEAKKKKPFNWGRFIYKTILFVLFGALTLYISAHTIFSISDGEVLLLNFEVRLPFMSRIEKIYVEESQDIEANAPLFSYYTTTQMGQNNRDSETWYAKTKLEYLKSQRLASIELDETRDLITIEEKYSEKLLKMVEQNYKPRSEYEEQVFKIKRLKAKANRIDSEIKLFENEYSKRLENTAYALRNAEVDSLRVFNSPISGQVNRIYISPGRYIENETMLNIINTDEIAIHAYIELDDIRLFSIGREVNILFPGFKLSKGTVSNIYLGTEMLPPGMKNDEGRRFAMLKIRPQNKDQAKKWQRLNGTNVKIVVNNFKLDSDVK